jgi:phosphoribosylformylglycinamidine cyclo-ligase
MNMGGVPLADAVMAPTRIYVKPLLALIQAIHVKGMAHITGGGLTENIPRVLPDHLTAIIDRKNWTLPPLFQWLQKEGQVADAEMHRVFNCGIGMVVIVAEADAGVALQLLAAAGESVHHIGHIAARSEGQAQTVVV